MKSSKVKTFAYELAADFRWTQFFVIICLMCFSLLSIYSATYKGDSGFPSEVVKQIRWFGIGFVIYFLFALVDYRWVCRKAWLLYLGVFVLLVWVLMYGKKINGAQRWISVHGFTFQPAEFAKITLLLTLCYYLSRSRDMLNDWRHLLVAGLLTLAPAWLINKEPDLGTALVVVALSLMLLFLAGASPRFWAGLGLFGLLTAATVGYDTYRYIDFRKARAEAPSHSAPPFRSLLHLKPYQLNRIVGVVAPDQLDPLAERWNAKQSLTAIGIGKFYGKGWMKGDVTRGGYLPSTGSPNDFIFSVFAETSGFVGGTLLIGLYGVILLGGVHIAMKARDTLGMLLAGGATFLLFFHVLVNMGMTLGILPIVGVPLPLMSYGGSFVVVCMTCLGLLQGVWLHRKPY